MKWRDAIQDFEWHLLLIALVLTALGIVFIWSAAQDSEVLNRKPFHQVLFLMACLPMMLFVFKLGYTFFIRYAYVIYLILLLMLILVLWMGRGPAGRWFDLPMGFRLQPSEFMKLGLVLALSRFLMYDQGRMSWKQIFVPLILLVLPMMLIIRQPDLGTALVLVPMVFGMLYAGGVSSRRLILIILLGILALPAAYYLPILRDYQRERVSAFFQSIPELSGEAKALKKQGKFEEAGALEDRIRQLKRDAGYQQFYAMVSVGSGGVTGKGLGKGPQNRMNAIPEGHTDFIFAIVGEEWGFLGCSVVLLLFFLMVAIILGVARRTREPFGRYLCTGVAILFTTQVFVNTGISVGLLPITGLTLPFISYGGSSLLSSYLFLAFVLDVGVRRVRVLAAH